MLTLDPPSPTRLTLRLRIGVAFLATYLCMVLALVLSLARLQELGDTLRLLDRGYVPLARVAARLEGSVLRLDADVDRLRVDDPRAVTRLRSNLNNTTSLLHAQVELGREVLAVALPRVAAEADRTSLETLDLQLQTIGAFASTYAEGIGRAMQRAEAGDAAGLAALQPELGRARGSLRSEVEKLSARVETRIRQSATRAAAEQASARRQALALGAAALGVGAVMLGLALRELRPITQLTRKVHQLAQGAAGVRVPVTQRHELGVLQAAFNTMAQAIEERDEQRARLAQSERLALVGQMLAQITHEVRNPLNALSLNAELLAEDLEALPPERREEAQQILGTLTSEVRRLEKLTSHYLHLARRPTPERTEQDLGEVVQGVLGLEEEELRRAGLSAEVRCPVPVRAEVDAGQLRQVLLNLVRNSQEAGASRLRVQVEARGALARITVEDDGPGLPEDQVERIFEPFRTSKAQGSGLGLAICRQILEDHGGRVWAEAAPQGARLVLEWPLRAQNT